jgi:REP element-mobilizing transposase RayT
MAHTYTSCLIHAVFATAGRRPWLTDDVRDRLHAYIGGIGRDLGFVVRRVGGPDDHVHVLLALTASVSIAKAMQTIKGSSSRWMHDTFTDMAAFAWQEGYGAFSIGVSQVDDTVAYIDRQLEHHRRMTFQDELRAFLQRHGLQVSEHDHDL